MNRHRRHITLLLMVMLWCMAQAAVHTPSSVPNVQIADSTRYVSNPDGILTSATVQQLDAAIASLRRQTTTEMAVAVVDDIDRDIDSFATALYEEWGLGRKGADNGVLMVISTAQRKAVIRTGYGAEGVLPDVICSRIIRHDMIPEFKNGNYDAGTLNAVNHIYSILTDPDAAAEMRAGGENSSNSSEFSGAELFNWYMKMSGILAVAMLIIVLYLIISTRQQEPQVRWRKLNNIKPVALFLSFFGLGMPLIAYLPLSITMKRIRSRHMACPNCGTRMNKLSEERDNDYLTPAQDKEEQLNSVDYDVWLCPNCGEKDVIPYENPRSGYTACPNCGAKACSLIADRVTMQPTTNRQGMGVKIYSCANCRHKSSVPYTIAKLATPIIIAGGGRGFGGGGGGIGGGFGGGMTGGGGASGGW